jgi:hypothetical protein
MKKPRKSVIMYITKPKPNLQQLLAKVTTDKLHHEVDTGTAKGHET